MRTLICLTVSFALAPIASAQGGPPGPAPLDILKGRPDSPGSGSASDGSLLGDTFESVASGIKFRVPAGMKRAPRGTTPEQIVRYTDNDPNRGWVLTAARTSPSQPVALSSQSAGEPGAAPGILEITRDQLKQSAPGAEVVREDVVTIGEYSVAMLAARFPVGLKRVLSQHAIVRADDRTYYTLSLQSNAARQRDDGTTPDNDPEERGAVEAFRAVVDTVALLDPTPVLEDQRMRLFRARALFINLTPPRFKTTLMVAESAETDPKTHGDGKAERYLRIQRDGKDVGYSYLIEQEEKRGALDGISVGIRSRLMLEPEPTTQPAAKAGGATTRPSIQTDSESLMWMTYDRKHETWRSIIVATENGKPKDHTTEIGASDRQSERVLDRDLPVGEKIDPRNPPVRKEDVYSLTVTTASSKVNAEPVTRSLPPFYIPQALGHLLPRVVPLNDPKTYMFASYVGETREVMSRYVDVDRETEVALGGKKQIAVPVRDRIGLEGSVTTHWMSPEGAYLGSTNEDSKITVLPSDEDTLRKIWVDAKLTAPDRPAQ